MTATKSGASPDFKTHRRVVPCCRPRRLAARRTGAGALPLTRVEGVPGSYSVDPCSIPCSIEIDGSDHSLDAHSGAKYPSSGSTDASGSRAQFDNEDLVRVEAQLSKLSPCHQQSRSKYHFFLNNITRDAHQVCAALFIHEL